MIGRPNMSPSVVARKIASREPRISRAWRSNSRPLRPYMQSRSILGRRDLLIIRAQVGAAPRFELEALDLRAWSTRGIERSVRRHQWTPVAVPPGSPLVAYSRGPSDAAAEVLHIATLPELSLVRVAVHRGAPNLEVQWTLAGLDRLESARLLETVRRLAQRL